MGRKKPPGRVADFWFCLCGTGTPAGDEKGLVFVGSGTSCR